SPGGEDSVFESEKKLVVAAGHQVEEYVRDNAEIAEYGLWTKATLGVRTLWAWDSCQELGARLRRDRPDLVHFHNTFPLISPAALTLAAHQAMGTWSEMADCYIALTEFARRKFIAGGFPPHKLVVKPNFVRPDPGPRNGTTDYALFVGRLSPEKGLGTLLAGWQ